MGVWKTIKANIPGTKAHQRSRETELCEDILSYDAENTTDESSFVEFCHLLREYMEVTPFDKVKSAVTGQGFTVDDTIHYDGQVTPRTRQDLVQAVQNQIEHSVMNLTELPLPVRKRIATLDAGDELVTSLRHPRYDFPEDAAQIQDDACFKHFLHVWAVLDKIGHLSLNHPQYMTAVFDELPPTHTKAITEYVTDVEEVSTKIWTALQVCIEAKLDRRTTNLVDTIRTIDYFARNITSNPHHLVVKAFSALNVSIPRLQSIAEDLTVTIDSYDDEKWAKTAVGLVDIKAYIATDIHDETVIDDLIDANIGALLPVILNVLAPYETNRWVLIDLLKRTVKTNELDDATELVHLLYPTQSEHQRRRMNGAANYNPKGLIGELNDVDNPFFDILAVAKPILKELDVSGYARNLSKQIVDDEVFFYKAHNENAKETIKAWEDAVEVFGEGLIEDPGLVHASYYFPILKTDNITFGHSMSTSHREKERWDYWREFLHASLQTHRERNISTSRINEALAALSLSIQKNPHSPRPEPRFLQAFLHSHPTAIKNNMLRAEWEHYLASDYETSRDGIATYFETHMQGADQLSTKSLRLVQDIVETTDKQISVVLAYVETLAADNTFDDYTRDELVHAMAAPAMQDLLGQDGMNETYKHVIHLALKTSPSLLYEHEDMDAEDLDILYKYVTHNRHNGRKVDRNTFYLYQDYLDQKANPDLKDFATWINNAIKDTTRYTTGDLVRRKDQPDIVYRVEAITPKGYTLTNVYDEDPQIAAVDDQLANYDDGAEWTDIANLKDKDCLILHVCNAYRGQGFDNLRTDLSTDDKYSFSCSILSRRFNETEIAMPTYDYAYGVTLDDGRLYAAWEKDAYTVNQGSQYYRVSKRDKPTKPIPLVLKTDNGTYNEVLPQGWELGSVFYTENTPEDVKERIKSVRDELRPNLPLTVVDPDTAKWRRSS